MADDVQDEPVQEGAGEASEDERVRGLLVQVAADLRTRPDEDAVAVVRQRLGDLGIERSDAEIERLVRDLPDPDDRGNANPGVR